MVTDQIADLLTRIRNALMAGHPVTYSPASKKKERILELLKTEGFIAGYEDSTDDNGKPQLTIRLRYDSRGNPVIREINRISKPGKRVYVGKDDIPRNRGGLGVMVVSSSKGVISDRQARADGLGGELLCSVF